MDKGKLNNETVDIARFALGAYQSYSDKPARVKIAKYKDGASVEYIYGQVNPCLFGDQCEGHSCYCNHPKAYRKCHRSWYYGEKDEDKQCEFYKTNPYWQDGDGDFYEQREKTLLYLKEKGLLEIDIEEVNHNAPAFYKERKSKLL